MDPLLPRLHARLPLELRRQIYTALFSDPAIQQQTVSFARPNPSRFPIYDSTIENTPRPLYLDPRRVPAPILREIVICFYETFLDFTVTTHPREIARFLNTDFFGLGVKPRDAFLRGLTVHMCSEPHHTMFKAYDPRDLPAYFQPLVWWSQKWIGKGFELKIVLWSRHWYDHVSIDILAKKVYDTLNKGLVETITLAWKRGARVTVIVKNGKWIDERAGDKGAGGGLQLGEEGWKHRIRHLQCQQHGGVIDEGQTGGAGTGGMHHGHILFRNPRVMERMRKRGQSKIRYMMTDLDSGDEHGGDTDDESAMP